MRMVVVEGEEWADLPVLVTGGASPIGSHLVEKLVRLGARVTVIDDLSTGIKENLDAVRHKMVNFYQSDLAYMKRDELDHIFSGQKRVFHLAAVHGGRGFITTKGGDICKNFAIDQHVFQACVDQEVEHVTYASSACIYPIDQQNFGSRMLPEHVQDVDQLNGYHAWDLEYGLEKFSGETMMRSLHKQYGLKGVPLRFITVYGPRTNLTHSIMSLIHKAANRQDPYEIWGDGKQERDFTYVDDIVDGCIAASEKGVSDCKAVNLGTGQRYSINAICELIFDVLGWQPHAVRLRQDMPTGPLSRSLDISRAREALGWQPKVDMRTGIERTIQWYMRSPLITQLR